MTTTHGTFPDIWTHSKAEGYNLARGDVGLPIVTDKGIVKVSASKSALVIIDMQNFFLHPAIRPHQNGLDASDVLLSTAIPAARSAGMQIIYVNWGLTDADMIGLPACHAATFGSLNGTGFGSEMGYINADIPDAGRMLFSGSWNAELWPPLKASFDENKGDVLIPKDRMSALWADSTALGEYLKAKGLRTLFWAGVNTDQCVLGSLVDAHSKGYDSILVKDICGTNSNDFCKFSSEFNAELFGFTTTAAEYAAGLKA